LTLATFFLTATALTACPPKAPTPGVSEAAAPVYKVIDTLKAPEGGYDHASIDAVARQLFIGREYGVAAAI
jgi:hypothetical protein